MLSCILENFFLICWSNFSVKGEHIEYSRIKLTIINVNQLGDFVNTWTKTQQMSFEFSF